MASAAPTLPWPICSGSLGKQLCLLVILLPHGLSLLVKYMRQRSHHTDYLRGCRKANATVTAYCFSLLNSKLVGLKQAEAEGCLLPQVCTCAEIAHITLSNTYYMHAIQSWPFCMFCFPKLQGVWLKDVRFGSPGAALAPAR